MARLAIVFRDRVCHLCTNQIIYRARALRSSRDLRSIIASHQYVMPRLYLSRPRSWPDDLDITLSLPHTPPRDLLSDFFPVV